MDLPPADLKRMPDKLGIWRRDIIKSEGYRISVEVAAPCT